MSRKVCQFINRLTGASLRKLLISAGFPYHKDPLSYKRIWVFIMLPFMKEESLADLALRHGSELKKLYILLNRHPESSERLLHLMSIPVFVTLLRESDLSGETEKSRRRIRIIADDTKSEKFGRHMEFIHKLSDHGKRRHITGYNCIFVTAASGDTVFPLSPVLWLPKIHPARRSRNDIAADEIARLKTVCESHGCNPEKTEILSDSAYCVQKVVISSENAWFRMITKVGDTHKFQFGDEHLTPREIIEKVKNLQWKYPEPGHCYQRITACHHTYGTVILTVRRRELNSGKTAYDVLMCSKTFINSVRIHKSCKKRWETELRFKYYRQYLRPGKSHVRKSGSVRSCLSAAAVAGLIVNLFRQTFFRKMSFRSAVRLIQKEICTWQCQLFSICCIINAPDFYCLYI